MSKQVPWNKIIVETFIQEALLTEEEEWVRAHRSYIERVAWIKQMLTM